MTKMGRPPLPPEERKSKQISVRLPEHLLVMIDEEALKNGTSASVEVRVALYEWFEHKDDLQPA